MQISKKLLSIVFLVPLLVQPVYAQDTATVDIPVTVEGTDNAKVTISSDDEEAMKALQGDTTISITSKSGGSFKVTYDEPVDYKYIITQIEGNPSNGTGNKITYDKSVYIAHVFVKAEDDGTLSPVVIAWPDGSSSKSESVAFKNVVETKKSYLNTGEGRDILVDLLMLLSGAGVAIFLIFTGKKHEPEQES